MAPSTMNPRKKVAALDKARKAMDEDPDAALAALEDYDKGFKGGVLSQEAEVLKIEALARADGNQTRAAEQLQITRRSLKLKMDRHGIAAS